MRIGIGIPSTPRKQAAPVVPGWLADVLSLGAPAGGAAGNYSTGINFLPVGTVTCVGIRAFWGSINVASIPLVLTLWDLDPFAFGVVATESVSVVAGVVQTTGAFGSHTLNPSHLYAAAMYNSSISNGYVSNGYSLPRVYSKYSVVNSYAYSGGFYGPTTANNTVCSFVEPLFA